jgi:hypothetical protein
MNNGTANVEKSFSDSDTCWLVTLTSLDPETLQKQIDVALQGPRHPGDAHHHDGANPDVFA